MAESVAALAARYVERGWAPLPVPHGEKGPRIKDWPQFRARADDLARTFAGQVNLGVILGDASRGLVDVDLDSAEALALAGSMLPRTDALFGRPGKPHSHRLYTVSPCVPTTKWQDPTAELSKDEKRRAQATLVELRGNGAQTIFPPSVHPSGEVVAWERDGDPAPADGPTLRAQVARLAAAALLARHWPAKGARHDAALALSGGLAMAGWTPRDVDFFVGAVAGAAGDSEVHDRVKAAETTTERLQSGGNVQGWPTLARLVGGTVVQRVRDWLGIRSTVDLNAATAPQNGKATSKLPTVYRADELMALDLPAPRWAVPGILPQGLSLLAGKPKLGKSWLALGLGRAIANGGVALGSVKVESGEVLYLALEDRWRRIQDRLAKLCGSITPPPGLMISTDWPRMDRDGLKLLREWLAEHSGVRLVIIDTLAKFRRRVTNVRSLYDEDYQTGELLKAIADEANVAILVIHHLRKLEADDPMDTVSGTLGLTGVVDATLVLKRERGRADATMILTGRDVDDQELALKWDAQLVNWSLVGSAADYRESKERAELKKILEGAEWPLTPREVAALASKSYNAVKFLLWKMSKDGDVKAVDGKYTTSANPANPLTGAPNSVKYNGTTLYTRPFDDPDDLVMSDPVSGGNEASLTLLTGSDITNPRPVVMSDPVSRVSEVSRVSTVGPVSTNPLLCLDCGGAMPPGWTFRCPECLETVEARLRQEGSA